MVIFRVFYDRKDFFGNWQYAVEDVAEIYSAERFTDALRKCFYSFGRVRNYAFRIEDGHQGGEFYLIEQNTEDARQGVYTVTHRHSPVNIDAPVKMSASAIRKIAKALYARESGDEAVSA